MAVRNSAPGVSPPEVELGPCSQDELQALIEDARQRARRRRRRFVMTLVLGVLIVTAGYEVLMAPGGTRRRSSTRLRVSQVAPIRTFGCEGAGQALSALAFSNVADGWVLATPGTGSEAAAGGLEVLGTRDAGSSWSCEWASSFSPGQVVATDARHAWVLGWGDKGCRGQLSSECESAIGGTRTGRHWSLLAVIHQTVTQLAFSSSSFGIAAAYDSDCREPNGMPPSRCPGQILATSDGGRHWRSVLRIREPIIGVATYHGEFWAIEARLGVAGYKRGRPGLTVLASTDRARSWKAAGRISLDTAGLRTEVDLVPGPAGRLWLSALDQDSCAMHGCGTDGVWFSPDAGRTWRPATPEDRMDPLPPRLWHPWPDHPRKRPDRPRLGILRPEPRHLRATRNGPTRTELAVP